MATPDFFTEGSPDVIKESPCRAILVHMAYPSYGQATNQFPVGIAILSEMLLERGIDHEVCDLGRESYDELEAKIRRHVPRYLCFSLLSLDIKMNYQIISKLHMQFPEIIIVAGGPHVSLIKQEVLDECPVINFAIAHEGEYSLPALLSGKKPENIPGAIYRSMDGKPVYNPIKGMIEDLDALPFPKYRKFHHMEWYGPMARIISSRGCPFRCTFCGAHLSMGKKWRGRSAANVFAEIKYWYDRGYRQFGFLDSNFFFDKQRVIDLCTMLEEANMQITVISDGMRANDVDERILSAMVKFGFREVAIGIESANDDILRNVKKGETLEQLDRALTLLDKYDISVRAFFIIGLPGETPLHTLNSFHFALSHPNISCAHFFNINPHYKTELYEWAQDNDYLHLSREQIYQNIGGTLDEPLFETPEYSFWQRKLMLELATVVQTQIADNHRRWLLQRHPRYSIIIPTRNGATNLPQCLERLAAINPPKCGWETLVIDNGSTDDTRVVAERFPFVRYIYDATPGLHSVRHRGAQEAKGEILCYLDDDSLVTPDWLIEIERTFALPNVVMVGGNDRPKYETEPPEWLACFWKPCEYGRYLAELSLLELSITKITRAPGWFVFGCNFVIRKDALLQIGGFEPDGMPPEMIMFRGAGETAVACRLNQAGYPAHLNPKIVVEHMVPTKRMTPEYFAKRSYNEGILHSYVDIRKNNDIQRYDFTPCAAVEPGNGAMTTGANELSNAEYQAITSECVRQHDRGYAEHQNAVRGSQVLQQWVSLKSYIGVSVSPT